MGKELGQIGSEVSDSKTSGTESARSPARRPRWSWGVVGIVNRRAGRTDLRTERGGGGPAPGDPSSPMDNEKNGLLKTQLQQPLGDSVLRGWGSVSKVADTLCMRHLCHNQDSWAQESRGRHGSGTSHRCPQHGACWCGGCFSQSTEQWLRWMAN